MPVAYVLFNTEIGAGRDVLSILKKTEGVQEAFNLSGVYDIIAKVKADTLENLMRIINVNLNVRKVHSKLTVILSEALTKEPSPF